MSTEDDVVRAYGALLAVSKFGDQLLLFGKIVSRDSWLQRRAERGWWQTKLAFLC